MLLITCFQTEQREVEQSKHIWTEMDITKMDWDKRVVFGKKKEVKQRVIFVLPGINPDRISYNYLNLFTPVQIDRERTAWLGTTITPLPGPRCGLDNCRKWRAIKETAGATISRGNVSLGDDHITMKALFAALLTKCILTNQSLLWQIIRISISCLFMTLTHSTIDYAFN